MSGLGDTRPTGSVYRWQADGRGVEVIVRGGVVWLHAVDDDEIVLVELPPEVVRDLGAHLLAAAPGATA